MRNAESKKVINLSPAVPLSLRSNLFRHKATGSSAAVLPHPPLPLDSTPRTILLFILLELSITLRSVVRTPRLLLLRRLIHAELTVTGPLHAMIHSYVYCNLLCVRKPLSSSTSSPDFSPSFTTSTQPSSFAMHCLPTIATQLLICLVLQLCIKIMFSLRFLQFASHLVILLWIRSSVRCCLTMLFAERLYT
jgi:hypothetical protein